MRTTSYTADYMVTRCASCGMMNVIPRCKDGYVCADCGGGPLKPMGYAILQSRQTSSMTVEVNVDRGQLDRLLEDVDKLNNHITEITRNMSLIREEE
jgi:hypothetical protein